jgi:hypothetical protein
MGRQRTTRSTDLLVSRSPLSLSCSYFAFSALGLRAVDSVSSPRPLSSPAGVTVTSIFWSIFC